jgi:GT2 family glycosyltransferase
VTQTIGDISVIICAYNEKRWDNLVAAIDSVRKQSLLPRCIILVIDHNPVLLSRAQKHFQERFANVMVVENKEQRGLSGARNSGIAAACSEFLAFLDDDAIASSDWLLLLCREFRDAQVMGVGGGIVPCWQEDRPAWFPEEFDWVVGCTYRGMPRRLADVRNLIGANMVFRRVAFEAVGKFRSDVGRIEALPMGCEETELCIRLLQHWPQRRLLYQPQAIVFHTVPDSRVRWSYFSARCYAEGLSKAVVARSVGVRHGLASERAYAMRILPQGIWRGLRGTILHGDLAGLAQAGTIIFGLAMTAAGYIVGSVVP